MGRRRVLRPIVVTALLLLSSILGSYDSQLFSARAPAAGLVVGVETTPTTVLGIDCGLGSTQAFLNPSTGVPIGDGLLDSACTWVGDVDGDGVPDPLVSDNPLGLAPGTGGGFTAEVRATSLPANTNGFDISVSYDTRYLNGVRFDLTGLPFGNPANTPFPIINSVDNFVGRARIAMTILTGKVSGDVTLFRLRLDVTGVGTSPLDILNDDIANPNLVPHLTQDSSLESSSFFGPDLRFNVSWVTFPQPPVPDQFVLLIATATCPACGPLSFSYDTDSDGTAEFFGDVAYIAPDTITVNRVVFAATDGTNTATAVRLLRLTVAVQGPTSIPVDTPGTWTGLWFGGIPTYTGAWRFCPGLGTTANAVCARPTATISTTSTQTNTQTLSAPPGPGAYHFAGLYTNTLRITDSQGTVSPQLGTSVPVIQTFVVDVTGSPNAYNVDLSNPAKANSGEPVSFTLTMTYDPSYPSSFRSSFFDVFFDFGDGQSKTVSGGVSGCASTSCTVSTTHIYNLVGPHTVRATARETAPAAVSKIAESGTSSIMINSLELTVDFAYQLSCTLGQVTFTGTASGGSASYTFSWDFGDGSTESGNAVTHIYATVGTFNVVLTVIDSNGNTGSVTKTVYVPIVDCFLDFTFTPFSPQVGEEVTFEATITGGTPPFTFAWNFGDGTLGTGSTVTHTYTVKGRYTITLSLTDSAGTTIETSRSINVSAPPLTASVTSTPSPVVGETLTFNATASGGTPPYSFEWDFLDGSIEYGPTVTHTYSVKGSYFVRLRAADANGIATLTGQILTVAGLPVAADFSTSPYNPTAGKPVTFSASVSGGTAPYVISWDFGDGSQGSGFFATHSYSVKGSYTATLIVEDANGILQTRSRTMVASPQILVVDFTFTPSTQVKSSSPMSFVATASGGTAPYMFTWNFGDGAVETGNPVFHSYTVSGSYSVELSVKDGNENTANAAKEVNVSPALTGVDFAPTMTLVGDTVFVAIISGGTPPFSCIWSFGDGTPASAGCDTSHAYASPGSFSATLTVRDANGESLSRIRPVTVQPGPLLVRDRVHWTRFLVSHTSATQNFVARVANPSTLTVEVKLTVDIYTDAGVFLTRATATALMEPFSTNLGLTASWTTSLTGKFLFTATLSYQADLGDLNTPPDGVAETVTGRDGSKSGSFLVLILS